MKVIFLVNGRSRTRGTSGVASCDRPGALTECHWHPAMAHSPNMAGRSVASCDKWRTPIRDWHLEMQTDSHRSSTGGGWHLAIFHWHPAMNDSTRLGLSRGILR